MKADHVEPILSVTNLLEGRFPVGYNWITFVISPHIAKGEIIVDTAVASTRII